MRSPLSSHPASDPPPSTRRRAGRIGLLVVGAGVVTLLAAACGSSSSSSSATTAAPAVTTAPAVTAAPTTAASPTTTTPASPGTVAVLSAGSLMDLIQKAVAPGFKTATGGTVNNFSAGSTDLAADIKGKVKQGDVFLSASPKADVSLVGPSNGSWVTWYATFATSKLVLGYNPKSKFADDLKTKPWYEVVTMPGFRLGLTPPATDPKGVLAVTALAQTAKAQKLPGLVAIGASPSNQFPETNLVGEVESGQLDAGFFYQAEANSAGLPTVPLTGVDLSAVYTLTILKGAPNQTGAEAFINYLLGPGGKADLEKYGFLVVSPPKVIGKGVPAGLSSVLGS